MKKKYLVIGGIVVIIVLIIGFLFAQRSQKQQLTTTSSNSNNQNSAGTQQLNGSNAPSGTFVSTSTAQGTTKQFYTYYFSSASNPLANGAYQNNPYLSPDFKNVIAALYNNGNDPIFCPENRRAAITVGGEQQLPYNDQSLTTEVINDASTGKQLYRVALQNVNGKWLIFDVNCIY